MPGIKLLICIAFHYIPERIKYVESLIKRFSAYPLDVTIIVDCNEHIKIEGAHVSVHNRLEHPYYLTWMHRKHIKNNVDNYDWFMYVEDDMDIPWENFQTYMENFSLLWPVYIPSFVRIEEFEGKQFITDMTERQSKVSINIKEKEFLSLNSPYHAFWIMPQKELKETLTKDFVRMTTYREMAASYPMWELQKKPMVMIENGQISPLCYSYHLTNNYAEFPSTPFAKIEINKLLI